MNKRQNLELIEENIKQNSIFRFQKIRSETIIKEKQKLECALCDTELINNKHVNQGTILCILNDVSGIINYRLPICYPCKKKYKLICK